MPRTIVEFREISKTYRLPIWSRPATPALHRISFTVNAGAVFALLGPNRAGKTTLLKILLGLCKPSSGDGLRLAKPLADRSTLARVGYMHENAGYPRYLTPVSLLELYGALSAIPPQAIRERSRSLLELVGLADRADQPISRFSKGMIQRLALAQALLADPDLLVLDEPTEGLDLSARRLLLDVVAQFRQAGKTVIVVSHSLSEISQVCDRVAVLVAGRLAFLGTLESLLHDPQSTRERSLESALEPIYQS